MKPLFIYITFAITIVASNPIPQRLTEEEFRAFRTEEDQVENKVNIIGGYTKIRRQGRNNNGRSISFNKPFTVRDPLEFAAAGRTLNTLSRREEVKKFPEMAPVFNLEDMLKAEAEKLRAKVEEASLMAAKAVEEAEEKVQQLTHNDGINEEEIEEMIEKVVDSAIDEAQDIIEEETESSTEVESVEEVIEDDYNSDESLNTIEETDEGDEDTTENAQPSTDIDLGSVQEV